MAEKITADDALKILAHAQLTVHLLDDGELSPLKQLELADSALQDFMLVQTWYADLRARAVLDVVAGGPEAQASAGISEASIISAQKRLGLYVPRWQKKESA